MCTHRGIRSTVALDLYRSIITLWYDKSSVWGLIGPGPLVIFVGTANLLARGNFEQKTSEKNKNYEIK